MNPSSSSPSSMSSPYANRHAFPCHLPNGFYPAFPHTPQPRPRPPPQVPPSAITTTTTTSTPNLSTTLSTLTDLVSLSRQTLAFPLLLPPNSAIPKPQDPNFVPCPYNPHHLMPPHSLFLHSLHCPSHPLPHDPSSLIHSLHYPTTLNPQNPAQKPDFKKPTQDPPDAELYFSLNEYFSEFNPNFFYKDCPAVVYCHDLDSSKKTFTLPSVLSVECVNFVGSAEEDTKAGFDENRYRLLPSDLWALSEEVENWVDYPGLYSYNVLCAILRLNVIINSLSRSVIVNSSRYGVVIDVYMRNHISVLFRLCFKATRREAAGLLGGEMNVRTSGFKCPVLVQALKWIVTQLSVLYGEVNAKRFAVDIFKQCILEAANKVVVFPLESNSQESSRNLDANGRGNRDFKLEPALGASTECKVGKVADESIVGEAIFVSQLVAAVAALHERSLLEAKIKGFSDLQLPPRFQQYISILMLYLVKRWLMYKAIMLNNSSAVRTFFPFFISSH